MQAQQYNLFGDLPDDYPYGTFVPSHPKFTNKATVRTPHSEVEYTVDLSINECTCKTGFAFYWDRNREKYLPSKYCIHKLRVMSSVIAKHGNPPDMMWPYVKALATRYNRFNIVSAFHKELRRGSITDAWYWASMLTAHRGLGGITKYLLEIVYEETRDHELAAHLIDLASRRHAIELLDVYKAVVWFCNTKKKWELPGRLEIFTGEMHAYRELAKLYTSDVAKGKEIIDAKHNDFLRKCLRKGYEAGDVTKFQMGLKGLYKSKHPEGHEALKDMIYAELFDMAQAAWDERPELRKLCELTNKRVEAGFGLSYHVLNALGDALMGEPYDYGHLPAIRAKAVRKAPYVPIKLGYFPSIPVYAHDNHTYEGKAKIRSYPDQMLPGADMKNMDLRLCGAYFGVAWRMLAFDQHKTVDVPWADVKWPTPLYKIVDMLWY